MTNYMNYIQVSITPPGGVRQLPPHRNPATPCYFYPRPPGGGLTHTFGLFFIVRIFYPATPGGGRLSTTIPRWTPLCDFYPVPPGGGGDTELFNIAGFW